MAGLIQSIVSSSASVYTGAAQLVPPEVPSMTPISVDRLDRRSLTAEPPVFGRPLAGRRGRGRVLRDLRATPAVSTWRAEGDALVRRQGRVGRRCAPPLGRGAR